MIKANGLISMVNSVAEEGEIALQRVGGEDSGKDGCKSAGGRHRSSLA